MHGFMADFGEGRSNMPHFRLCFSFNPLCDFASGFPIFSTSAADMQLHNNFSCAWLETVSTAFSIAAQRLGVPDDFVAFARSGCIAAARHSRLFWAGDQLTSWDSRDGIGSALTAVSRRYAPIFRRKHVFCTRILSHCGRLVAAANRRFFRSPCLAL